MTRFRQDLRYAARRLIREPGFAATAVLTLALGIGANTAIFSVVQAVLLRPLPYPGAERLVMVWNLGEPGETTWLSASEVMSYGAESKSLASIGAWMSGDANLTGGQEPERVRAATATPALFSTLGVPPLLGRTFDAADATDGRETVVVLGHGLWQRRFGGEPSILGRDVQVNGRQHTVVGVMPPTFRLPLDYRSDRPIELWTPAVMAAPNLQGWGNRSFTAVGRLAEGATAEAATSEFELIARGWIRAGHVRESANHRLFRSAVPLSRFITGEVRTPLLVLLAAVGLVLVIACANVVNLLLAKASTRTQEIAIRLAVGAERRHLVRQLLTESLLLSMAGGAAGVALAWAALRGLAALAPANVPRVADAGLDPGVLVFTAVVSLLSGAILGMAPALQFSRFELSGVLKDGGRTGTGGRARHRVRGALVVAQLAISVVLVIGAGLLSRSLIALTQIDLGFSPAGVVTALVQVPASTYPVPADVVRFYEQLIPRLEESAAIERAAAVRVLPLASTIGDWSITIEGRTPDPAENPNADFQVVTPGYFEVMGLSLARGRFIGAGDHGEAPLAAVVNEVTAARFWPGQDAIGKRFHLGTSNQPWFTIVGIVRPVRHNAVVEDARAEMYLPHAQMPRETGVAQRGMAIVIGTGGDVQSAIDSLRAAVRSIDASLPVAEVMTMDEIANRALAGPRFTATLLGLFALLALTLAAIGVYGTVSLLVTERVQEIGIRMALGASRGAILGMVLGHGAWLASAGLAAGVAAAFGFSTLLDNLLYGVGARDPLTFVAVPLTLAAVTLGASLVPALRATRVNPISVVRV